MPGLILEGGSLRTAFTCGVLDLLLEEKIYFPYVIGVSAGACAGASYCSMQQFRSIYAFMRYRPKEEYASIHNLKKEGSFFGVEYIYETIPNKLLIFDYDKFRNYPGKIVVVVTNARTGKAEYLDAKTFDKRNNQYKATCAVPGLFPSVKILGGEYFDGGCADSIPLAKSMSEGNEKNLVVLTQPREYRKHFDPKEKFVSQAFRKQYPFLSETIEERYKVYNEQRNLCIEQEKLGNAVCLYPSYPLNDYEKTVEGFQRAHKDGFDQAKENLDRIKDLFK